MRLRVAGGSVLYVALIVRVTTFGSAVPLLGDEPPASFCLTTCVLPHTQPADPETEDWFTPSLFARELVRQGLLLAARESFGVATRDQTLREPLPESNDPSHFECDVKHVQAKRIDYVLRRGDRDLLSGSFPYRFGHAHAIEAMQADAVEELSRGAFTEAIGKAGYTRRKRSYRLDAPLPSQIDAALLRMDLISQYRAVRLAHQSMEKEGESIALLGALTRGYANLAQLTAYHHSSMRHAFAARSLLYGTRLIRISKESPSGYWHRAYAFTLIGLTKASMFDLEKAGEMEPGAPTAARPTWLQLVEWANQYDYPSLNIYLRDRGEHLELAALLWFRSVEFSNSQALTIEVAKRSLQASPMCLRIMHGANRSSGVGYLHMTTQAVFPMFTACLAQRLPQLAEEETILADVLQRHAGSMDDAVARAGLITELVQAAGTNEDVHEPSLAVLARLIQEEDVLHVGMRAAFLRDSLGVDSSGFLDDTADIYREHPLGFLIASLRLQRGLPTDRFEAIVGEAVVHESNLVSSGPLFNRLPRETRFKNTTSADYHSLRWAHASTTDIEYQMNIATSTTDASKVQKAKWMFDMNPHAPYRYVVLIEHDWENSKQHLDEWEEKYGHHPAIALALGKQFEAEGDLDRAEEYYANYISAVPDYNVYVRLARLHHRRGDDDKMLEVARSFLEQEDYGLGHASMSKLIAYTLMAKDKYKDALPWAQRSAQSYSAWGLMALADCYEGLKDLEKAEEICNAIDERYESSSLYDFAVRTGHGDVQRAWQRRLEQRRRYYPQESPLLTEQEAIHDAYEGRLAEAVAKLQPIIEATDDPLRRLMTAALAVRADQAPVARSLLEAIAESDLSSVHETVRLKEFVQHLLQVEEAEDLDSAKIKELAPNPRRLDYAQMNYVAACFLEAKGDTERAIDHYREAARSALREAFPVMLSWIRLRELGDDPLELTPYYAGIGIGAD